MPPTPQRHLRPSPRGGRGRAATWRSGGWWLAWVAALAFLFEGTQPAAAAETAGFSEYEVKAAWLFNFARFVEWPTNTFANASTPLVVGVMGRDSFGRELEKAFVGRTIRGRPVVLKRNLSDSEVASCHLIYFSMAERRRSRDFLEKVWGTPVLTVGESDEFLDQGGIINFVIKEKAVRFEINVGSAQSARLRLDANLLKVAVSVRGRYE